MRVLYGLVIVTAFFSSAAFGAEKRAVFAGGCFWGVEAVFEHVNGVLGVRSGYAGDSKATADYDTVSSGRTKHAESVEIRFDDSKITYEQLLYVFFAVAHDPTEVDRQGPDTGPQYRSVIFYADEKQKASARAFITAIDLSKAFTRPVASQLSPLSAFYPAEDYHQDYLKNNPTDPYIVAHDLPKLAALKQKFPELYREKPSP